MNQLVPPDPEYDAGSFQPPPGFEGAWWANPEPVVVDLSGGKPPDHFANQNDLRKAVEMERRLFNLLRRANTLSHSLAKVYQGAVPTPTRWQRTQDAVSEMDKAVTEAWYQARRAAGVRMGKLGWGTRDN